MVHQAFMDETKAKGLIVVAAVADLTVLPQVRRELQGLRMKGQRRVHFVNESDSRRKLICSTMQSLPVLVDVYDASAIRDMRKARAQVLDAVVADLAAAGCGRLVIERDDSLVASDREVLFRAVRRHGVAEALDYVHVRGHEDEMLWIPDAVAWCLAKGGPWPERINGLVRNVHELD